MSTYKVYMRIGYGIACTIGAGGLLYSKQSSLSTDTYLTKNLLLTKCDASSTVKAETGRIAVPTTSQETALAKFRPSLDEYELMDWDDSRFAKFKPNHALHDTLYGDQKVEAYEIYKHKNKHEIFCVLKFGSRLNGYPGILHGGISALVLDNSYGWLFMTSGFKPAFTANLDLNYRSPIRANSFCVLRARVHEQKGRKLRMSATLEDAASGKLQVESTTLFVSPKTWADWASIESIMKFFNL